MPYYPNLKYVPFSEEEWKSFIEVVNNRYWIHFDHLDQEDFKKEIKCIYQIIGTTQTPAVNELGEYDENALRTVPWRAGIFEVGLRTKKTFHANYLVATTTYRVVCGTLEPCTGIYHSANTLQDLWKNTSFFRKENWFHGFDIESAIYPAWIEPGE